MTESPGLGDQTIFCLLGMGGAFFFFFVCLFIFLGRIGVDEGTSHRKRDERIAFRNPRSKRGDRL